MVAPRNVVSLHYVCIMEIVQVFLGDWIDCKSASCSGLGL